MTDPTPSRYRVAFAGRAMRPRSTPSEWINTPELQIFSQILDTLVARTPDGNVRSSLAQFEIAADQTTLALKWTGRRFEDGSLVLADEVIACLHSSCWKYETLVPESRHWFSKKIEVIGPQEIHFTQLNPQEAIRILKHLTLADYGIYKNGATDRKLIGTGPYRIKSETTDRLVLEPNRHHPEHSRAVSLLEFLCISSGDYREALARGEIDEYLYYGTIPSHASESSTQRLEHIPSTHAAVGILIFNAQAGVFKNKEVRSSFSALLGQAIRDGYADASWASPRSITPPGFEGHGAVDYLDLSKIHGVSPSDPRPITIATTNSRQRKRVESLFRHPAFAGWAPNYVEFKNYDDLRIASQNNSEATLDVAFVAIRSDTLLANEFFDFLNKESSTCLFASHESEAAKILKNNPSSTIFNLENLLREEAICFPLGYYFMIRVVAPRGEEQVGSSNFEDSPRYLRIESDQTTDEWNSRRIRLEQYWRYSFDRRAEELLYSKASRAIHDLKSPLALLSAVAHSQEVSSDSAALIKMARARIDEIINEILPAASKSTKSEEKTSVDTVNPKQLITQVLDEIKGYAPANLRFQVEASDSDLEVRLPKIGLYSIAANLIKNAAEALTGLPDGVVNITVASNNSFDLLIQDNGPGFTHSALEAINSGNEYSSKPQGSGVGLKQAIQAIRANGGGVTLKNHPRGGAMVQISVPRLKQ